MPGRNGFRAGRGKTRGGRGSPSRGCHLSIARESHQVRGKFRLAIADEAHRPTGVVRERAKGDLQAFHDGGKFHVAKQLYMTVTPRTYLH